MLNQKLEQARARKRDTLFRELKRHAALAERPPTATILFGSIARGNFSGRSDIDTLVIANPHDTDIEDALFGYRRALDMVYIPPKEWSRKRRQGDAFVMNIAREGIVIQGRLPDNDDVIDASGIVPTSTATAK